MRGGGVRCRADAADVLARAAWLGQRRAGGVVVDVPARQARGEAARRGFARAAVLQQHLYAFLTAGTAGVAQGSQAAGVPALHIHAVLRGGKEKTLSSGGGVFPCVCVWREEFCGRERALRVCVSVCVSLPR